LGRGFGEVVTLDASNLVRVHKLLFWQGRRCSVLWKFCCLFLGAVSSIPPCKCITDQFCPFGIPGGCKVNGSEEKTNKQNHRYKMETDAEVFSCFQLIQGKARGSFWQKQFLKTC
jgi:hypothetical protein